ncbi:hypothetical protein SAMN02745823_00604 [Sporobacter termitidis DSM 10068]|uniref:Uncharacterized protein n=1 Tax=Sporobacter termitidis DSM 10068 TaxID=1123282 RepID=A0A1M5UNP1_9FIRM|nr:hypothetical protein [Sporobacter termitidis]SHH64559.1 hypothetical protein SAMN02745823_00604 [Sporobacter termitidis DSM 10068]
MNRRKLIELVKDAVIVLLVLSAVFLGWESRLFGNTSADAGSFMALWQSITGGTAGGSPAPAQQAAQPGKPVAIALTDGAGGHYGVKYSLSELDNLYVNTARYFLEALSSAQPPQETDAQAWRAALKSLGVYFEYISPVRLSVLGDWLGISNVAAGLEGAAARRLCVIDSGGKNYLYFQDDATGKFYMAQTAVLSSIADQTGAFSPNSAVFAFEKNEDSAAPYTLLLPDVTEHPALDAANPLSSAAAKTKVLLTLGVSELPKPYTVDDTEVYVRNNFIMYLSNDGTVSWTAQDEAPVYRVTTESEAIDMAADMIADTLADYCGSSDTVAVYYDSTQEQAGGGYRIFFRYVAAGGAVYLRPDGYAASITVKNGRISEMELRFRTYSVSTEPAVLLPEVQAAAAAGGDFMLGYDDDGSGRLAPFWPKLPLRS